MYVDKQLELSDAQAVTEDAASTNVIKVGAGGRANPPLWLVVNVHTTFDSAGDAGTLAIKLQTDSDEDFGSAKDLFTSKTFAQTELTAGANLIKMPLPEGMKTYMRLYYENGTEKFTAGKLDAFLTMNPEIRHKES